MTKFIVLYTSPQSAEAVMEANDPAAAADSMQAWLTWASRAEEHVVDLGAPLGNGHTVTTGGISPAASGIGGYSILEADSVEHAIALMGGHPHLSMPGASIEVYESLQIAGM